MQLACARKSRKHASEITLIVARAHFAVDGVQRVRALRRGQDASHAEPPKSMQPETDRVERVVLVGDAL